MKKDWHKYKVYITHRLRSLQGTPQSIAAGAACGVAVSFTPFVGAHLVLSMLLAWCIRGNIVAAALGTAVGNPWTFPFIWVSVFYIGNLMTGESTKDLTHIDFVEMFAHAFKALMNFDFSLFFSDIWPILWPMIIGCIPFFVIVWTIVFYIVGNLLRKSQNKA